MMTALRQFGSPPQSATRSLALLLARLCLGGGLLVAGVEKSGKIAGHCVDSVDGGVAACEAQVRADCATSPVVEPAAGDCLRLGVARCADDRVQSCAEARAGAERFFADLRLFGREDWRLPGGGRVLHAVTAAVEVIAGLGLIIGLLARLLAIPALVVMTVAMATVHFERFDARLSFTSEAAMLYAVLAAIVLAFGPGRFALDAVGAAGGGGGGGGGGGRAKAGGKAAAKAS